MNSINAQDARKQLRSLLDQAMLGESTTITRSGQPVAVLIPFGIKKERAALTAADIQAAIDDTTQVEHTAAAPTHRPVATPLEVKAVKDTRTWIPASEKKFGPADD